MKTYNIGCEVYLVAYNGRSQRSARTEAMIQGVVEKVTANYIHVRSYDDWQIWKSPRWI